MKLGNLSNKPAFTIVELLVVIVVIGILAAITIVSYTGISQKAVASSLQSDLTQASKQLEMFYIDNSVYPNVINDCPTPTSTNLCLKPSGSNQFTDYSPNNTTNPPTYSLAAKNNTTIYIIANNSQPTVLSPAPLNPVADWIATTQGNHYGNFYDLVGKQYATVTRSTPKTIYDPATQKIYDVPAGYLAINPRSDGKRGSEAVIEEGRTNYLLNSYGAANNGSKWSSPFTFPGLVNGNLVYSLISGPYSSTSQRVEYSGVVGDSNTYQHICFFNTAVGSFSAGNSATVSFYIKGNLSGISSVFVELGALQSDGTFISEVYPTVVINSNWNRVSATYANLPALTSKMQARIQVNGIDNGDNFDISVSSAQLEKGAFATSYIPTTTAVASRNPDSVTIPTTGLNSSNGTIFMAQKIGQNAVYGFLGGTSGSGANNFIFDYQPTGSLGRFRFNGADGNFVGVGSAVYSLNQNYVISGRWSESQVWYSVDGVSTSPVSTDAMTSVPSPYILHYTPRADTYNRIIFYPITLSGADVTTVTNAIKDGP